VIEKMDSVGSTCARGSNPLVLTEAESLVLRFGGAFAAALARANRTLNLWKSDLRSGSEEGTNPPDDVLMVRQRPLVPTTDGTVELLVNPNELFTISTLGVGHKPPVKSPPRRAFPMPFVQSFDGDTTGSPAPLWYDQMGAWEIQPDPRREGAKLMRQVFLLLVRGIPCPH
jgi:hypothetical protein